MRLEELPEETYFESMKKKFTAVIKQDEGWWIGWIAEIPGVNSQGKTRAELMKNLRSALKEALEFNQAS
jgi:predicted RNase H-like HicB family nuclease